MRSARAVAAAAALVLWLAGCGAGGAGSAEPPATGAGSGGAAGGSMPAAGPSEGADPGFAPAVRFTGQASGASQRVTFEIAIGAAGTADRYREFLQVVEARGCAGDGAALVVPIHMTVTNRTAEPAFLGLTLLYRDVLPDDTVGLLNLKGRGPGARDVPCQSMIPAFGVAGSATDRVPAGGALGATGALIFPHGQPGRVTAKMFAQLKIRGDGEEDLAVTGLQGGAHRTTAAGPIVAFDGAADGCTVLKLKCQ